MTTNSIEIINGHILGDASIVCTNPKNKTIKYSIALFSKHYSYLEYVGSVCEEFNRPIWNKTYLDPRTNMVYASYYSRTLPDLYYNNLRKKWYPNGVKIVPEDLKLTPTTLLHWFMDDGSKASSGGIYFATDGFNSQSMSILKLQMESILNCKISIHKNDNHFRLYIPKPNAKDFYKLVGDCPSKCFQYKWKE